ncbi:MAG TPA: riboflavin synthase [Chryseosolibacter sp.]
MFTGIIESLGTVSDLKREGTNLHIKVESPISNELKIDQSVSHDGVCLTVTRVVGNAHWVTAVEETIIKSNFGSLAVDKKFNLERCMLNNGRFDGHIVQGHVDQVGTVNKIEDKNGSWLYHFEYDPSLGNVTVEKGSISVNGVSLTCFNSQLSTFTVAIIPYTHEHTNFHALQVGHKVNLEFDVIGKYVKRLLGK